MYFKNGVITQWSQSGRHTVVVVGFQIVINLKYFLRNLQKRIVSAETIRGNTVFEVILKALQREKTSPEKYTVIALRM